MNSSSPDEATGRPQQKVGLWLLALITLSGTLGMHVFVPALPYAAEDLGAGIGAMQLTISLYILGLGVGQLAYGPLSDRFGRRPVLMAGLALYAVSGLAAALATSVDMLIFARLFQALGGCSGLVLGRAIVRDISLPHEATKRLALMNLMVTAGPGIAPLVGSAMASTLGWRSIFFFLAAAGVANFVMTLRLLPETRGAPADTGISALASHYRRLLRSPAFLGYSLGGGCATTSMYAFIAAAPFILVHQLQRPAHEVGLYLAVLVSGVWLGSALTSRLVAVMPLDRLLVRANAISVLAAFVFLAAVLTDHLSVALTIGSMFMFTLGVGVAAPVALTKAISVDSNVIGSASGLYGFGQMSVGAMCTAFAGLGGNPALATGIVLATAGVIAQASFWLAKRYSREKEDPVPLETDAL